jgi:hypothetical protein
MFGVHNGAGVAQMCPRTGMLGVARRATAKVLTFAKWSLEYWCIYSPSLHAKSGSYKLPQIAT